MARVPQYQPLGGGMAAGARRSVQSEGALASMLTSIGKQVKEVEKARAEAARTIEQSHREVLVRRAFDEWLATQAPYQEDGTPRFSSFPQEAADTWEDLKAKALDGVTDPALVTGLEKSFSEMWATYSGRVFERAVEWEVEHRKGQVKEILNLSVQEAAAAGSLVELQRAMESAERAVAGAVRSGVMSPEQGAAKLTEAATELNRAYIRARFTAGDHRGALEALRAFRPTGEGLGMDPDSYFSLADELVTRLRKEQSEQEKLVKEAEETYALNLLLDVATGKGDVADVDAAVKDGRITDLTLYTTVRNAAKAAAADKDDDEAIKWFMTRVAKGQATIYDLSAIRDKVTAGTYMSLASLYGKSSQSRDMFANPVYRQATKFVDDRLRMHGRLANRLTFVEKVLIPEAQREITTRMLAMWEERQGALDYNAVMGLVDEIVARYEQVTPGADSFSVRNAPPPRYKHREELERAYQAGEFGKPGLASTQAVLADQLRRLELWEKRKSLEAQKAQEQKPATKMEFLP